MKIEKICEFLNEIGILEYENINLFFEIYSKLNNEKYNNRSSEKLRDTLAIYLNNNFIKNNQIKKLSQNILTSYNNYQLILKYRTLNNMKNILLHKVQNKYIYFLLNLSLFLLKKNNNNSSKIYSSNKKSKSKKKLIQKKIEKNDDYNDEGYNNNNNIDKNEELISSDDERECTFTPKINKNFKGYKKPKNNNIESHIYYSPAFNITSKFPITNYQNNIPNNNYNNIQRQNVNMLNDDNNNSYITENNYNNYSHFSNYTNYTNYNNYNIPIDNRSNRSYKIVDNINHPPQINNEYILQGLNDYENSYYSKSNSNYYNNGILPTNNTYNNNNNIYNSYINPNMQNRYNNFNNSNISDSYNRSEAFYNRNLEYAQRVKDKIQNKKIEKYNKMKEECTFEPKINTNYKGFNNNPYNPNNIYQQQQVISQQGYKSIPINVNNISNISGKNIIEMKKNPIEIIRENNLNQNSFVIQKKKDMKKRAFSEKKKGIKIIEDLSLARKRRTDKTKRLMKEKNFTPKIRKSDKYKDKVTMSFEDRRLKSIQLKNKYKKAKNDEDNKMKNNKVILAPSEMVRFVDNKNDDYNNNSNILNNNDNGKKMDISELDSYKKINKTEFNNDNNNNNGEEENYSFSNNINKKEIEKNKILLMDRIKGEHKIGFKSKKEDGEIDENQNKDKEDKKDEIKNKNEDIIESIKSQNDEIDERINSIINNKENENKKEEYSFNVSGFHSNALKSILEKNKNDN